MMFVCLVKRVLVVLAITTTSLASSVFAADKPDLVIPAGVSKLEVGFADAQSWDGKRIPVTLQCGKRGGVNPVRSPELKISGSPAATQDLVVFFSDPRAFNNHGLFTYSGAFAGEVLSVPPVGSGGSAKMPKGVVMFQGGSTWGAAYNAPCPLMSMQHQFKVTVYARDAAGVVIAVGEANLGFAE